MDTLEVPEVAAVSDERAKAPAPNAGSMPVVAELADTRTQDFGLVGVTWDAGSADDDLVVQVRTRTEGEWTGWEGLDVEETQLAEAADVRGGTSPVWVGESDGVGVRLLSAGDAPTDVELVIIDGGDGLAEPAATQPAATAAAGSGVAESPVVAQVAAEDPTVTTDTTVLTEDATDLTETDPGISTEEPTFTTAASTGVAPKPAIVTRKGWGVNRSYESSCSTPLTAPSARGITLHHTAGANGYSREAAPGIVRGIHLYHTKSLRWCDIGYNFLVDSYGKIYEGRRGGINKQVRGAHAGNWDANLYTTGISMVGNYETVRPTTALKSAVVKLSAWRLSYFGRNAKGQMTIGGKRIPKISGHRDIYSSGIRPATATACPGKFGYEWLNGGMRGAVQRRIDAAAVVEDDLPTEEPPPVEDDPREPPVLSRLAGDSRYSTAAEISRRSFTTKNGTVFLASGETFPDALSGGPAAAGKSAPILLARKSGLPAETEAELQRLTPSRIFILGGKGVLSARVARKARTYAGTVTRLAGPDRYATGVAISRALWSRAGVVYVASGGSYPDALSGGALAARQKAPILLSDGSSLPTVVKEELTRLKPTKVVLLGGAGALSKAVRNQIARTVPAASVTRLSGSNRYATSAAITRAGWTSSELAYFAAGTDFPDALAGVPAAALRGAPVLLTHRTCMPDPVADVVDALSPQERVLLGGSAVLRNSASTTRCG